jgi:hypothetical protein
MNQIFKGDRSMNVRRVSKLCMVAALAAMGTGFGFARAVYAQQGRTDVEQGIEVLTRGPVHEAFAETVTFDPEPGIEVPNAAPDPIEELPPEQRPEGVNVTWIPGYWAWDDERSDFLWVSGIWRALPPGRQWVPGYWAPSERGYLWTAGYWADAEVSEIEYLPEPPESVEAGPNIEAPSADYTWLPGCWVYQQGDYAWRPGYWAEVQPDWVWVPAHYVWTPRGYVFVDGYWDYSVDRRGVLFAPVYFDQGVYTRRGFSYSPAMVINLAAFTDHLFLRPGYGHYYFGDYYGSGYSTAGFSPWFSFYSSGYGYDPFYAHARWRHRQDRDWDGRVEGEYRHRRDHEEARPARTFAAWKERSARGETKEGKSPLLAMPLDELTKSKDRPMRFQALDKQERQKLAKHGQEVRKSREERQRREIKAAERSAEKRSERFETTKERLPRSPIVAKPVKELDKDQAPPKTHEAPKPDPKVERKPRKARARSESPKAEPKAKKSESKPDPPKAEPQSKKPEPKPESPKAEPKEKPKSESKEKPKN